MDAETLLDVAAVISAAVLAAIGWLVFLSGDRRTASDAGRQLEQAAGEQRKAADAVDAIGKGIEDSKSTVESVGQSLDGAERAADGVEEANKSAAQSVDGAAAAVRSGEDVARDSAKLIESSTEILREIRKGTRTD